MEFYDKPDICCNVRLDGFDVFRAIILFAQLKNKPKRIVCYHIEGVFSKRLSKVAAIKKIREQISSGYEPTYLFTNYAVNKANGVFHIDVHMRNTKLDLTGWTTGS